MRDRQTDGNLSFQHNIFSYAVCESVFNSKNQIDVVFYGCLLISVTSVKFYFYMM